MSEKPPILVAEDEAMLRVIAVEMLEDAGFKVLVPSRVKGTAKKYKSDSLRNGTEQRVFH